MRVLKSLAAMAAAVLLCGPAMAADPIFPVDPQKAAAARATADAAIVRLGMGDYFANATDADLPRVRHKASGLSCLVDADPAKFGITLGQGLPPGDDVTCSRTMLGQETLRAVRFAKPPSLGDAMSDAVKSLKAEVERAKPYKGAAASAASSLAEGMRMDTARFTGRQGGKPVYARVSVLVMGDWVFVQKMIAPAGQTDAAELLADVELVMAMLDLMITNPGAR
jgi:hypothetical protein